MKRLILALLCALVACSQPSSGKFGASVIPNTFTAQTITASTSFIQSPLVGGGSQIVTANNSGVFAAQALSTVANRAYYGDGSNGACTFDGSSTPSCATKDSSVHYTLNSDCYCTSIVVASTVLVDSNGWRGFNTGTTTLNSPSGCSWDNSGQAGGNGAGGTATGGAGGGANSIGGTSSVSAGGVAAINGGSPLQSFAGAGGNGAGSAGTGGTITTLNALRPRQAPDAITGLMAGGSIPETSAALKFFEAGAGGGGGLNTGSHGGGGGGGGGVTLLSTHVLVGTGSVCANGGPGGNASGTDGSGGGGGGGVGLLITNDATTWSGTLQVNGGAAGTGGSATPAATAGSSGFQTIIPG